MADSLPEKSVQDSKPTETVKGKDLDINGGSN